MPCLRLTTGKVKPTSKLKEKVEKHTFVSLQRSGLENQVSSTTTSGVLGLPLKATAATEDVTTTLLTDEAFEHEPSTFSVPFNAGSISSA